MGDYSDRDPKGWCGDPSRGAALGRPSILGEPEGVITVRESPLDRGGYDRNGTYFGHGGTLFWYSDEDGNVDAMERAPESAIRQVLEAKFPGSKVVIGVPLTMPCYGAGEEICPLNEDADPDYGDLCEECDWTQREIDEADDD